MLIAKRKQLTKAIIIQIVIAVALLAANVYVAGKVKVKVDETTIYNAIVDEYPNLVYDKELAKIAEDCAELCYEEGIEAKKLKILENEDFVKRYSMNYYVAKYTLTAESNDDFIESFLSAMQTEKHSATDSCLRKCQYIGVGKYEDQVFILAYYNE